jgi:pSer/pThr/pTyr-binding forkhead associated (FHA) protein
MARIIQADKDQIPRQFIIDSDSTIIGRSKFSNIQLSDIVVSSKHAEIIHEQNAKGEDIFFIQDLQSTNGCFVNKRKITCKQLRNKDRIRIGNNQFTFIL